MNARKCVHAQKPYPTEAFAHESSKVGGRGKREEERQKWWITKKNTLDAASIMSRKRTKIRFPTIKSLKNKLSLN